MPSRERPQTAEALRAGAPTAAVNRGGGGGEGSGYKPKEASENRDTGILPFLCFSFTPHKGAYCLCRTLPGAVSYSHMEAGRKRSRGTGIFFPVPCIHCICLDAQLFEGLARMALCTYLPAGACPGGPCPVDTSSESRRRLFIF